VHRNANTVVLQQRIEISAPPIGGCERLLRISSYTRI